MVKEMTTRRIMLLGPVSLMTTVGRSHAGLPTLTGERDYREAWFVDGFLELGDALESVRPRQAPGCDKRAALLATLQGN